MEIGNKTATELIDAMSAKKILMQDIAKEIKLSDRTIQKKFTDIGYKWNKTLRKYEKTSGFNFKLATTPFKELFLNQPPETQEDAQIASDEVASTVQTVSKPRKPKELTGVLAMYLGDHQTDRIQRNYYMQKDVIEVINKVPMLKRSDFINDCLRQYFKDNGIL